MNLFGRRDPDPAPSQTTDDQALARYRYMLASAPPEDIERAHEEAFSRLTPEQRQQALQALAQHVPEGEVRGDDPASLARAATRAEIRQPGTIERAWGAGGAGGAGFGLGSWFLTTMAASFVGTAIAQSFFENDPSAGGDAQTANDGGQASEGAETVDAGSADQGDSGDFGGDAGGDDFGGGDFGGGDFGGF